MDIIAAISTGPALSAIGIVRVSGEGCFALCDRVFHPLSGRPFSPPLIMGYCCLLALFMTRVPYSFSR